MIGEKMCFILVVVFVIVFVIVIIMFVLCCDSFSCLWFVSMQQQQPKQPPLSAA